MSQNTNPIFVGTPNCSWSGQVTTANTAVDGTGTVATIWTAGANGGFLRAIRCKAGGTNVASVARFFLNNGGTNATAANNVLIGELALPATTGSNTVMIGPDLIYSLNRIVPAGYVVSVCIGTTVATWWNFEGEGGNY